MKDPDLFRLRTEHFTIEGRSRAGHETYFRIRELGIALDVGRCPDMLIGTPNILVTHAHLDHAVGIPFYAGQRHLQRMPGGNVFVPSEALDDFRELMRIHERLEGTKYDIELIGLAPNDTYPLGRNHTVRAHQSTHRVPARGYEIVERRHHLRPEYAGLDGQQLAALRHDGRSIHDESEVSMLFYSGDTDAGIFDSSPALFKSEVLMLECSFVAPGHEERAVRYRHIHFDDIARVADRFENRVIVLTHFSKRYAPAEVIGHLRDVCPRVLRDRLRFAFPEPFDRL
ncbi:MAG TPA: MBL fold metallo-hydrolase [Thermoanaerobaculia bacterium]|jgi:ribonuclease Z|nr:MBL fold metallo-hydrolase [Thermoanaerobaculia bacterium]